MTEKLKQTIPVKTSSEIFQEVGKKIEDHKSDASSPPSFIDALGLIATNYSATISANEARKTPEQRAHEAEQSRLRVQASKIVKDNKKRVENDSLFKSWIKRDTWLVYDEALPLTKANKPEPETLFNSVDADLWALVQSCAGHSLALINKEAKPKQWRVVMV